MPSLQRSIINALLGAGIGLVLLSYEVKVGRLSNDHDESILANKRLLKEVCRWKKQGRISHIGKLGTCLGRQLNRGSTPQHKKKVEVIKKPQLSTPFPSNPIAI